MSGIPSRPFAAAAGLRRASGAEAVAIQGWAGSFSDAAARRLLPGALRLSFETFDGAVAAVREGAARWALIPAANTNAGSVADVDALAARHRLRPVREIVLPIRQCLIAAREVPVGDLCEVRSHPVALRQCGRFLAERPWIRPVPVADTGAAVRDVCAEGRPDVAAIAGGGAAEVWGGVVLAADIADRHDNLTRFVLLEGRGRNEETNR
jgi:prephenate dehydratase